MHARGWALLLLGMLPVTTVSFVPLKSPSAFVLQRQAHMAGLRPRMAAQIPEKNVVRLSGTTRARPEDGISITGRVLLADAACSLAVMRVTTVQGRSVYLVGTMHYNPVICGRTLSHKGGLAFACTLLFYAMNQSSHERWQRCCCQIE